MIIQMIVLPISSVRHLAECLTEVIIFSKPGLENHLSTIKAIKAYCFNIANKIN